jgi:hypothetical protein
MSRRSIDPRVSFLTADGRMFWESIKNMQLSLLNLSDLYFHSISYSEPVRYKVSRDTCIYYAQELKDKLEPEDFSWIPKLPKLVWSISSVQTLSHLEEDVTR